MKIGFYYKQISKIGACALYRCIIPAQGLNEIGHDAVARNIFLSFPRKDEFIILHRCVDTPYTKQFVKLARALGSIVFYDTDDLIFTEEGKQYLHSIGKSYFGDQHLRYKNAMDLCDGVFVSTPTLFQEAKKLFPNVILKPHGVSLQTIDLATNGITVEKEKVKSDFITVAYLCGSESHDEDLQMIEEQLFKVLQEYKWVKLLLVGKINFNKKFYGFGGQFEYREKMPFNEFIKIFFEIDINLIPIVSTSLFTHSKSELKFIEASCFGVPSIASPSNTHLHVIENNFNGLIAQNNEWFECISRLIDDEALRKKIGGRAQEFVLKEYHPVARAKELDIFIKSMMKNRTVKKNWKNVLVQKALLIAHFLFYKAKIYLKNAKKFAISILRRNKS